MKNDMLRRGALFKAALSLFCTGSAAVAEMPLAISYVPPLEERLLAALSGRFDTVRQFARADGSLKVLPTPTGVWLDRQFARMTRVEAPALGKYVLFLEWRSGGPEGPVSRQRIWTFEQSGNDGRMTFYALKRPLASIDAAAKLGPDDLVGYPEDCAMRWVAANGHWTGRIDPRDCRIVSQSGRGMRLDVTITTRRNGFDYREAGTLDNGQRAFAGPPTMPYRFVRVTERR